MDDDSEILRREVLDMKASGRTTPEIARMLAIPESDVNLVMDGYAARCVTPQARARTIGSELLVLDEMSRPFIQAAKAGDAQAAIVVLKIQTRRAQLLGLDAPIRHDPIELVASSQPKPTSTQELRAVFEDMRRQDKRALRNGGPGYGDWRDEADREELALREREKAEAEE
jgi:hypothetical protein